MPNAHSFVTWLTHGDPKSIGIWTEPLPMCIADLHLSMDWGVVSMMSFMSRLECKIQISQALHDHHAVVIDSGNCYQCRICDEVNGFDNAGNDQNIPKSTAPRALNFDRTQASGKFTQC
jgi:hypothetical protein